MREHGVKSAVNVLIKSQDFTFGVLEADSVQPRRFGEAEVEILQGFANVLALVVVQNRLARENYALVEKRDLLLRELAHRTKNNNQILLSMINLQKQKASMLDVSVALDEVINRIYIMNTLDDFLDYGRGHRKG
jgi:two-component sensor histidine kinase